MPATPLARSRPPSVEHCGPRGGWGLFLRHPRTDELARPFGDPAQELPKAQHCVCDNSRAGSQPSTRRRRARLRMTEKVSAAHTNVIPAKVGSTANFNKSISGCSGPDLTTSGGLAGRILLTNSAAFSSFPNSSVIAVSSLGSLLYDAISSSARIARIALKHAPRAAC